MGDRHHLPPLVDRNVPSLEISLELHSDLFSPTRNPFRLPIEEIWNGARAVEAFGGQVLVPDAHHALLHCCLHFSWSHTLRKGTWRTVRDIASLCGSGALDRERFVVLARTCGGSTSCYWSLRLARALGGVAVPESVLSALRPAGPDFLLNSLEDHFRQEALAAERRCPSGRLRKLLWTAAIRPRSSGHGGRRPWSGRGRGEDGDVDVDTDIEDVEEPQTPLRLPGRLLIAVDQY